MPIRTVAPGAVPEARRERASSPKRGCKGMVRLTNWIERGMRRAAARGCRVLGLAATAAIGLAAVGWAAEPKPWQLGFQPPATPVQDRIVAFHDGLWPPGLMIIITLITVFVLALLVYVTWRFHHTRNPVPTRTTHNSVIEILWTVVPVLILVLIAIPSFKLMYFMDRVPDADMTIKVTAHQWYWSYAYPDQENLTFDSNIVEDKDLKPGQKRLLEVDNPLVVPVGAKVRVLVTGTDVLHSWFVPSFGVQQYAVIGRNNEAWFQVERAGAYYGECNQICGINHSRMPIKVVALAKPEFEKWLGDAKKKFAAAPAADQAPGPVAAVAAVGKPEPQPAGN
jgi:cytochrome c oxidase subunit II